MSDHCIGRVTAEPKNWAILRDGAYDLHTMGEQVAEFTDKYGMHFVVYESANKIRYIIQSRITIGETYAKSHSNGQDSRRLEYAGKQE